MVGAPSIRADFGVSYLETAGTLLVVPLLASMVLEPALLLLTDRYPRKWFIAGGLLGMALGALACGLAPSTAVLSAATALAFVATGVCVPTAQAALIDASPGQEERVMTRWAMLGVAGDLTAPLLMATLAALSAGWRGAYLFVAGLTAVWAILAARLPTHPARRPDDADRPGMWASLTGALRNRRLVIWLFASWLCCLLDEIVVIFGSLHLRDRFGAGVPAQSAVMAAFLLGSAVGLAATDRLLGRIPPHRMLLMSAVACGAAYLVWMAAPSLALSALAMSAVGAFAAPLYPLTTAQAFAALPGRPGTVLAAGHLFDPLDIAVPLLLGWLADRHGTAAALLLLLLQPAGVALIAALCGSRPDRRRP